MNTETQETMLVTGAAGFIDKEIVARLLEREWGVGAMVRRPESALFAPYPLLEIVVADMRDGGSLRTPVTPITDEPESDDINIRGAQRLVAA